MREATPHYPYPTPIEAYGPAGFRFAGMSHKGSLLCLPAGIYAFAPRRLQDVTPEDLTPLVDQSDGISFCLFGTGRTLQRLPDLLRAVLKNAAIQVDQMDTGAACATYNILLAEKRPVAAVLLQVD